jgi:exodeoxyribonuclease VII small subunit
MAKTLTYKELSEELEKVMGDLERGDLDIDEAVKCYERGLQLVRELEDLLKAAENKVTQLKASTVRDINEIEE